MASTIRDPDEVRAELNRVGTGTWVDATGDGGVMIRRLRGSKKEVAVHGSAERNFVEVHYQGFLVDGDEMFDSSRETGYPMVVQLGKGSVIAGWEVALQIICVGELAEVVIKPDYAYGNEESEDIPAGSTLRFEIEVLDARKTPKAVAAVQNGDDAEVERLAEIRRQRERDAEKRAEEKKIAEEKRKQAAETAAARLANKGHKGGKGKGKKK